MSNYAFWIVIAAYVIFDRGTNWLGMLSDLLLGLAVVGVFIDIPFVSNYAGHSRQKLMLGKRELVQPFRNSD